MADSSQAVQPTPPRPVGCVCMLACVSLCCVAFFSSFSARSRGRRRPRQRRRNARRRADHPSPSPRTGAASPTSTTINTAPCLRVWVYTAVRRGNRGGALISDVFFPHVGPRAPHRIQKRSARWPSHKCRSPSPPPPSSPHRSSPVSSTLGICALLYRMIRVHCQRQGTGCAGKRLGAGHNGGRQERGEDED